MKIDNVYVEGILPAIIGMRNPLDSHHKSDTTIIGKQIMTLGEADLDLSRRLTKAGPEHCKHLRMIHVWVNLTLPRYIWSEFDTYHFNTKVSDSTMHTIDRRLLMKEDFMDCDISSSYLNELNEIVNLMQVAKKEKDTESRNELRRTLKKKLPEGFLQKRTVDTNYSELLSILNQRKNHKLPEWHTICDWIVTLPYFKELTGVE